MIVLAHRGLRRRGPENTLPGFQGVVDANKRGIPLGVEFDVRISADDVLVTVHDPAINMGPGKSELWWSTTWYEAMKHFLGENAPPRLEAALDIVGPTVPAIDFDIQERGYTERVIKAASSIDPQKLMFSSHIPEVIIEARKFAPDGARIGMSCDEYFIFGDDALLELLKRVDADFLFLQEVHITPALVTRIHDMGKGVGAYTVNDPLRLRELIDMGVEYPCTDKPEMAVEELAEELSEG